MTPTDALTLALLLAIPVVLALFIRIRARSRDAASGHDGPLVALLGGLGLAGWISWVGPDWSQRYLVLAAALIVAGLAWHVARTVERFHRLRA